jgi:UDP-glucose 4-epimerase
MLTHGTTHPRLPARVVVLGARGFISRHLQDWCAQSEAPVLAIASKSVDLTRTESFGDLAGLLRPDDAIVMTSALTPDKGRDRDSFMKNLRMAETVCLAVAKSSCAHFVYLSSDAVYDAEKIPLDEDSTREPTNLYALSHTAREMMLSEAMEKAGVPICLLRLTNIYGPGDTHNAYGPNRFVRSALKEGRIELFGRGEERRSHVFIKDTVKLIGLALTHRSSGVLNVAVRRAVSFSDIAQMVVRLVGKPVSVESSPRRVPTVHRPYKPTQVFRFLYHLGRPIGPIVHRTFVNSAVFDAFPDFRFSTLESGIAELIEAEREESAIAAGMAHEKRVLVTSSPQS